VESNFPRPPEDFPGLVLYFLRMQIDFSGSESNFPRAPEDFPGLVFYFLRVQVDFPGLVLYFLRMQVDFPGSESNFPRAPEDFRGVGEDFPEVPEDFPDVESPPGGIRRRPGEVFHDFPGVWDARGGFPSFPESATVGPDGSAERRARSPTSPVRKPAPLTVILRGALATQTWEEKIRQPTVLVPLPGASVSRGSARR